jgi:transposase-like protein
VALAVFSSDPISSTAYATEEILLVLVFAGAAATQLALPISIAIVGLLAVLVASYRQIIKVHRSSGGAYVVTRDNFGGSLASVAGAALIIDYILTVAVSVSAGTAALVSAFPGIAPYQVALAVGCVLLLTWGNLRGIRESGRVFAVPTYLYVVGMAAVVVLGVVGWATGDLGPIDYTGQQRTHLEGASAAIAPVTLFLLLHAAASVRPYGGCVMTRAELETRRLRAAELFAQGATKAEVAAALQVSAESVRRWHARWRQGGAAALQRRHATGRPPTPSDAQLAKVHRDAAAWRPGSRVWQRAVDGTAGRPGDPRHHRGAVVGHHDVAAADTAVGLEPASGRSGAPANATSRQLPAPVAHEWPRIKRGPPSKAPGSCSSTSPASACCRSSGGTGRHGV